MKKISRQKIFWMARVTFLYLINRFRYKKYEFGAQVLKPLRVNGHEYISIGRNAVVQRYTWLFAAKIDEHEPELIIGEGCAIGDFNHICAVRRVVFGRNVLLANGIYISDNLHGFEDIHTPIMHQPVRFKAEVHIGDGSWIGENVCIIGARIGKNCVIGANSVVTRDVPDYSIAVGSPAKVIKRYNPETGIWEQTEVKEPIAE
jgi:acetyltransferase-like isoleucine patch superfamily enzyme